MAASVWVWDTWPPAHRSPVPRSSSRRPERSVCVATTFCAPDVRCGTRATPNRVGEVRIVSGEFHEDPWIALQGWGRGFRVRSSADLEAVRNFINDKGTFRRAVVFENLTAPQRRDLITAIERIGVELREFTDRDKAAMAIRAPGVKDKVLLWGSFVLASPFLVARRLQGRTTKMLEISSCSPTAPPDGAEVRCGGFTKLRPLESQHLVAPRPPRKCR
jgi:hypothetical protein